MQDTVLTVFNCPCRYWSSRPQASKHPGQGQSSTGNWGPRYGGQGRRSQDRCECD